MDLSSFKLFQELWPQLNSTFTNFLPSRLFEWDKAIPPINLVPLLELFSAEKLVNFLRRWLLIKVRCILFFLFLFFFCDKLPPILKSVLEYEVRSHNKFE